MEKRQCDMCSEKIHVHTYPSAIYRRDNEEFIDKNGNHAYIDEDKNVLMCDLCSRTCFECSTVYEKPIVNEDKEPWCADCASKYIGDASQLGGDQFQDEDGNIWRVYV